MLSPSSATDGISTRESLTALAYFGAYLAFSFRSPGSEARHYLMLVVLPLLIVLLLRARDPQRRRFAWVLSSFGLRRGSLRKGVLWALTIGLLLGLFQLAQRRAGPELWDLIQSGKALYLFPLAAAIGLATAGFTEEFFFRGFLQTRLERLFRSPVPALLAAAVAFGLYHVPYAYLNPNWPTVGDFPSAFGVAMVEGGLGGLILGGAYVLWNRNLLACIVLHGMIDAVPIMTLIRFSGAGAT